MPAFPIFLTNPGTGKLSKTLSYKPDFSIKFKALENILCFLKKSEIPYPIYYSFEFIYTNRSIIYLFVL